MDEVSSSASTEPSRTPEVRTFLITDVRGYTRYTREHGDEAASRLAEQLAEVVREVVPNYHGELLELRGDEAVSVFFSAREAIRAAVALQRQLREQGDGEAPFPLGVGMGIDSGEAVPTEGGYRGSALNLAARLCAIAKPGQILVSDQAAHLAGRVDGVCLAKRRPVRLKGMERPVRLVEVVPEMPLPPLPEMPRPASHRWMGRRSVAAIVGVFVVAVVGVVATLVAGGGGPGGRVTVHRDALVFLSENGHARVVGPVGASPSGVAVGGGWIWVSNRDDGTVTKALTKLTSARPAVDPAKPARDP